MKRLLTNRQGVLIGLLVGLLFSALFAEKFSVNGVPLVAQSGDGAVGETDTKDSDDANESPDRPIVGTDLEQASAAALDFLGEGRVTDTEVEDEEGAYEVEITRGNGRQVDVHLDEAFSILGQEKD